MGIDFLRPGLKTGVENGIFWSEIGSGFRVVGGTPHQKFQGVPLPGLFFIVKFLIFLYFIDIYTSLQILGFFIVRNECI